MNVLPMTSAQMQRLVDIRPAEQDMDIFFAAANLPGVTVDQALDALAETQRLRAEREGR